MFCFPLCVGPVEEFTTLYQEQFDLQDERLLQAGKPPCNTDTNTLAVMENLGLIGDGAAVMSENWDEIDKSHLKSYGIIEKLIFLAETHEVPKAIDATVEGLKKYRAQLESYIVGAMNLRHGFRLSPLEYMQS